jgi:16S rRNA (guanine966-N2)-methyltransferase
LKLRIVGGSLSGRTFLGPSGDHTRPTAERVREAVFSALEARGLLEGARVLDLYAGTGALAFEALSRGAVHALSVESDGRTARNIEEAARALGFSAVGPPSHRTLTLDLSRKNALSRLGEETFDLIFADPPWAELKDAVTVLSGLVRAGKLEEAGHLVLVHAARDPHPSFDRLAILTDYRYGDTAVVLYVASFASAEPPAEEEETPKA